MPPIQHSKSNIQNLLSSQSTEQCREIVSFVGNKPARFRELLNIFTGKDAVLSQRAAWPLGYIGEAHPELLVPHLETLLKMMQDEALHPAIRRSITRVLQFATIPEKYEGELMDTCFRFIGSPLEAPAVKASAITILENLWRKYPEIGPELHTALNDRMSAESPAFRSRAQKLLSRLG